MKKSTLWKICAFVLLIAVCLPLIPNVTPTTSVAAVSTVAPLPYAMEQYGQNHSGIYKVQSQPTLDGSIENDNYTLIGNFDDQMGNYGGVFVSSSANGSTPSEPATEFVPDLMEIYGTYDAEYLYLFVQTITRTTENGYSLKLNFGFNFGAAQKDAQDNSYVIDMAIPAGETEVSTDVYKAKTQTNSEKTSDSSGEYYQNATVYECKLPWSEVAPEGMTAETDFDRFYLSGILRYFDGTTDDMYWVYGVPNVVALPSGSTIGAAFGANAGTFTPNVINLLGENGAIAAAPEIASVERTDDNKTLDRTFEATLSLQGVSKENVRSAGVIFSANTASIGILKPVWTSGGENVISTTESSGESTLNFKVSFGTTAANYDVFFSLRPFVECTDGTILYGASYSNTPGYFDAEDVEYTDYIRHLMIGNSFCTYFLDEMVQIAKADKIHLTVVRAYKSGASAYEHWTFMVNDFKSDKYEVLTRRMCSPEKPNPDNRGYYTLPEILEFQDWTSISAHDRADGVITDNLTPEKGSGLNLNVSWQESLSAIMHLSKIFRYLEVNYPNAKLYFKQPWAFQFGYGYEKGTVTVEDGKIVSGVKIADHDPEKRMETVEQQTTMYETIATACKRYGEITGLPRIPCGDAWQIARANPVIGDTLCNKTQLDSTTGKVKDITDYYHEGDIGGGQYLNAAVYYEVLTGNDVRGNTWRPSYDISDEKILALQEAAHEAVLAVYGPDHYTK